MAIITLKHIAELAGVSPTTASRVLNGSDRIPRRDIAERVRRVAEELGYIPNAQAQSLARAKTGLLGIVVHDIADPYFSMIARGIQMASENHSKVTLLASTARTPSGECKAVEMLAARRADAIILVGSRREGNEYNRDNVRLLDSLKRYCDNGGKVAVVGQKLIGDSDYSDIKTLVLPNESLACQLASMLVMSGLQQFFIITGPRGLKTADDRAHGFRRGLSEYNIEPEKIIHTQFSRDGGFNAASQLPESILAEEDRCVFATSDVLAMGLIAGIRERGFDVPKHVKVAGFDDIETLRDFYPALSTARLPLGNIGIAAVNLALREEGLMTTDRSISGDIIIRQSTYR